MFDKTVANAGPNSVAEQQTPQGMSPEGIATMIEAQRIATQADVAAGKVAPLPYTSLTPQEVINDANGIPAAQTSADQISTRENTSPQNQMPLPGRPRFRPF
jgi:hypothetical protein